jgi:hypothetical protein
VPTIPMKKVFAMFPMMKVRCVLRQRLFAPYRFALLLLPLAYVSKHIAISQLFAVCSPL